MNHHDDGDFDFSSKPVKNEDTEVVKIQFDIVYSNTNNLPDMFVKMFQKDEMMKIEEA